jgi:hypothetical protein
MWRSSSGYAPTFSGGVVRFFEPGATRRRRFTRGLNADVSNPCGVAGPGDEAAP